MPSKTVVFEGKTHVFPNDATDDEIRQALEGSSVQAPPIPRPPLPAGLQPKFSDTTLGALTGGVDPSTFVERLGGAAGSIANTFFPAGDTPRPNTLPTPTPQEDIGTKTVAVAGGAQALSKVPGTIGSMVQRARSALAGGDAGLIEQQIAPRSAEAAKIAAQRAPELAQDPLYLKAKQAQFDTLAHSKFKAAEHTLTAAQDSVPLGTTVPRDPILKEIAARMEELQIPAGTSSVTESATSPLVDEFGKPITSATTKSVQNPAISGHPDALKVLGEEYNKIASLPEQIPFKDVRKYRQQLDDAIYTSGGWKETGTAADRAAMEARRDVVNTIRAQTKGISPALDKADAAYSQAADTLAASGIDRELGRRLLGPRGVGKPSDLQRRASEALKAGAIGAAKVAGTGAAAAGVYRLLKN